MDELTRSIKVLKNNGQKLAEAERDYKIILRQEALKLRANDMPVTLVPNRMAKTVRKDNRGLY